MIRSCHHSGLSRFRQDSLLNTVYHKIRLTAPQNRSSNNKSRRDKAATIITRSVENPMATRISPRIPSLIPIPLGAKGVKYPSRKDTAKTEVYIPTWDNATAGTKALTNNSKLRPLTSQTTTDHSMSISMSR